MPKVTVIFIISTRANAVTMRLQLGADSLVIRKCQLVPFYLRCVLTMRSKRSGRLTHI